MSFDDKKVGKLAVNAQEVSDMCVYVYVVGERVVAYSKSVFVYVNVCVCARAHTHVHRREREKGRGE